MKVDIIFSEVSQYCEESGGADSTWMKNVLPFLNDKYDFAIHSKFEESTTDNLGITEYHKLPEYHRILYKYTPKFNPVSKLSYINTISKKVRKDTDTIIVENRPLFIPIIRNHHPDKKIVLHIHNDHLIELPSFIGERVIQACDVIVGVSDYIVDGIRDQYHIHSSKCLRVYNGVDTEFFSPRNNLERRFSWNQNVSSKTILFIGRLTEEKGVHLLLESLVDLKANLEECPTLLIVGANWYGEELKGDYVEKLQRLARPVEEHVEFTGYLPRDQLPYVYSFADVCVIPSIWNEPFGLVVCEAMASGTSVIATNRGGPSEIVADCGIIQDPENVPLLSKNIQRLIGDSSLRTYYSKVGRERMISNFKWKHTASEFEEVLSNL